MFIFGGIFEVTKELNDVQAFSLKTREWTTIYEDEQSPQRLVRRNTILNQGAAIKAALGEDSSFSKIARDQSPGPGEGDRT
jgi:hypothetical protein